MLLAVLASTNTIVTALLPPDDKLPPRALSDRAPTRPGLAQNVTKPALDRGVTISRQDLARKTSQDPDSSKLEASAAPETPSDKPVEAQPQAPKRKKAKKKGKSDELTSLFSALA